MPSNKDSKYKDIKDDVIPPALSPEKAKVPANVTDRFSDSITYKRIKASATRYARINLVLVLVLITITALTIFGLSVELVSDYREELIMAALVVNGLCILLFIADMFGVFGRASKIDTDKLLGEQSGELLGFFGNYVGQKVLPSIKDEEVLRSVWNEPDEVMLKSQINDKTMNRRAVVIGGLWRKSDLADEDTTIIINMMFNKNYSKLTVKDFSVNRRTLGANNHTGDKADGK